MQPWDEMYGADGEVRPGREGLAGVLDGFGSDELIRRARLRDAHLSAQGITFTLSGRERPLPMDLVPRIVDAAEWQVIETGVAQRIRALEMFLADIYGAGEILRDQVIPRRLVTREAHGVRPANGVRIHVAGVDLVRDDEGTFRVLEDNLRSPSGVSYVLENRRTLSHVVPEIFTGYRLRSVEEYPARLLGALLAAAPLGVADPTVVVLTPGVHNSAHFEHAFLARRMGVELVEGRDLFCRDGVVRMRTTRGSEPVHVIYRRIDDDFLDPVHFRPDSVLGVPGILNAARAGAVTIANGVGNGVADDKAIYPYVPTIVRYYLGEEPLLPNVRTYDLRDPEQRAHVLPRLDRMVVKPVDGSGGYGIVVGSQASDAELATAAASITADPRGWIAQPIVNLSTSPTLVDGGRLAPRHLDLRPFAVNDGERVWVLPGGLTRVALVEGSLVVNSSQGGGSKDTWVLDHGDDEPLPPLEPELVVESGEPTFSAAQRRAALEARARVDQPTVHSERLRQQEMQQQQSGASTGEVGSC
ncbi:MAG: circularly permuted type 2 ATP-grasp protein [Candidatus Nanopelagicales bacterium]|nr:circularly permuted type 2 ATP-grasp protein [Candidatus Nanopelagicales bacterium]